MTALERICAAFSRARVRYAIVGGYAVALHGAVRGTMDIDVIVSWDRSSLRRAEKALLEIGLVSRLPITANDVFDFRDEYIKKRSLIAWNFYNPRDLSEQVDIIITHDLKGKRRMKIKLATGVVQILALGDLIRMKKESGRPQDLEDARALEQLR